ncbi:MAG: hypothetical protein FWH29_02005 [Methanobrevibacter sp.]|nr:hypothetical protein [Methanobrevibacter sp.]
MICSMGEELIYDGEDISVLAGYECRTIDNRKKYTEILISDDIEEFKKFIGAVQYYHEHGITEEPPEQLLRINIDKFLNENIIEYI